MKIEFARFLIVGALAASANITSRIMFDTWMDFVPAISLAFVVGLTTAFFLNRSWVFLKSGKHWLHEAIWFTLINLVGLAQTVGIAWVLARVLLPALGQKSMVETTAHTIGVLAPILTSYLGHKYITFRRPSNV